MLRVMDDNKDSRDRQSILESDEARSNFERYLAVAFEVALEIGLTVIAPVDRSQPGNRMTERSTKNLKM
jgi:hypothetical protein